ncbi:MAG: class I SAM-dependent methyltransferase [Pyrinomonadaceae bacterium]|nr:class I SAM-dependent methyltransferase [Pyrinomonadaceae bacterium]
MSQNGLSEEIAKFQNLWEGGYYEGDPLVPLTKSSYSNFGYISTLYATYLRCIRPYINAETVALEIGPGRGTWTKGLLGAKEIWTLDALSAEHNKFFEYLNHPKNVNYIQVEDFECKQLPENHFNYMFSFGCLCHIPFEGVSEYAKNIFGKLQPGSNCFWMIADKDQYELFKKNAEKLDIWKQLSPKRSKLAAIKPLFELFSKKMMPAFMKVDDFSEEQGRWHHAGTDRTCEMLEKIGYKIIEKNVGTVPRDPIIHFIKP